MNSFTGYQHKTRHCIIGKIKHSTYKKTLKRSKTLTSLYTWNDLELFYPRNGDPTLVGNGDPTLVGFADATYLSDPNKENLKLANFLA